MEKIAMLVPDSIICVYGTSNAVRHDNINVDAKTVELALTSNDYHSNYYFPEGSIQVIAVEKYPKK